MLWQWACVCALWLHCLPVSFFIANYFLVLVLLSTCIPRHWLNQWTLPKAIQEIAETWTLLALCSLGLTFTQQPPPRSLHPSHSQPLLFRLSKKYLAVQLYIFSTSLVGSQTMYMEQKVRKGVVLSLSRTYNCGCSPTSIFSFAFKFGNLQDHCLCESEQEQRYNNLPSIKSGTLTITPSNLTKLKCRWIMNLGWQNNCSWAKFLSPWDYQSYQKKTKTT